MAEAAPSEAATVSKGEYARLCGVTPGRVSQWISEGKITREALDGDGVRAKIIVAVADAQLKRNLDISQRLGNGLGTVLDRPAVAALPASPLATTPTLPPTPGSGIEDRIKAAKLQEIEFRNRDAAAKELAARGYYVRADETRAMLGQVAAGMQNVFEGALADFATAVAAKFEVPQRDVLHLLRAEFRAVREKASKAARKAAEDMPALEIEDMPDLAPEAEPAAA